MQTKQKTKQSAVQHTALFGPVRNLVFQLPAQERFALYKELHKKEWNERFDDTFEALSKKAKSSGYTAADVPKLIQEVRKKHFSE